MDLLSYPPEDFLYATSCIILHEYNSILKNSHDTWKETLRWSYDDISVIKLMLNLKYNYLVWTQFIFYSLKVLSFVYTEKYINAC